ncbi:MAG: ABC transporter permease [Clostridia bacterium]|nr:ABC transporter permease [Clostridia bacterium]
MKHISRIYTALVMVFLYAPIAVMVVYSFNASRSTSVFGGFSLKWYAELLNDSSTIEALENTLVLAVLSSLVATVLGTLSAVGIFSMKKKWAKTAAMTVTNIPMMNPDIVTGISLMLLFVFVGQMVGSKNSLGFGTMLIAHITFNLPYVILSVLPKLRQTDHHLAEAAQDLGCTPFMAFFKVILPSIMPGVFSGLMMAFTLSLDDFVISYFTTGPDFQTLPIKIFSMTKRRVTPDMYALSTLIFLSVLLLLILSNVAQARSEKRREGAKA